MNTQLSTTLIPPDLPPLLVGHEPRQHYIAECSYLEKSGNVHTEVMHFYDEGAEKRAIAFAEDFCRKNKFISVMPLAYVYEISRVVSF